MRSSHRICWRRCAASLFVVASALLGAGWLSGPQSTLETEGPVSRAQTEVFYITLWVTGVIFVIVAAVLAYATIKFKAKDTGAEKAPVPPQGHGNPLIELSLIFASVAALVVIAIPTMRGIWFTYDVPEAEKHQAYTINAQGLQWWFRFEYPSEEITVDDQGTKSRLVVANEMVIPVGRPVRLNLRTYDVIHSFWVPKLAGKVDMMPNRGNHMWLKADKAGYYWGQCAEYCGESHAVMRFRVIALDEADFKAWVANQKKAGRVADAARGEFASYDMTPKRRNAAGYSAEFDADPFGNWKKQQLTAPAEDHELIAKGKALFNQKTCVACHVVRGHFTGGNPAAPDLTHFGSRTTLAGGLLENNPANLHRWITDPNGVKPGNKMYVGLPLGGSIMPGYMLKDPVTGTLSKNFSVNDEEARALVAFLSSLK